MTRNIIIFLATFVVGAVIALGARAVRHDPNAEAAAGAGHQGHVAKAPATPVKTVNTVCAICGMDVDPDLPTADYKGQKIGFGCAACPPKFAKNPDKWGPAALKNEVVED